MQPRKFAIYTGRYFFSSCCTTVVQAISPLLNSALYYEQLEHLKLVI
uniref:Uncharacterized protein n=1 Tax=Lepeophtheirus salmonis TaxID=72036 RepID=A0A0K2URD1_LEPSM